MSRLSAIVLLLFAAAMLPAVAGPVTITAIHFDTTPICCVPSGDWGTDWMAAIGVSLPGASNNPFLDPGPGGAMSEPSGSYLLFFGWEDRFAYGAVPAGAFSASLTVYYSDSSFRTATFLNNVLTSSSTWSRLSGNPLLVLGSSGITNVDRVGDDVYGVYSSNGHYDAVLQFSDTGSFGTTVPEPGTLLLVVPALGIGILFNRRRHRTSRLGA